MMEKRAQEQLSDCEERFCRLKYQFTIIKDHTKVRQGDLEVAKRENLAFKSLVMDHAKVIYEWEAKVSQLEEEGAICQSGGIKG